MANFPTRNSFAGLDNDPDETQKVRDEEDTLNEDQQQITESTMRMLESPPTVSSPLIRSQSEGSSDFKPQLELQETPTKRLWSDVEDTDDEEDDNETEKPPTHFTDTLKTSTAQPVIPRPITPPAMTPAEKQSLVQQLSFLLATGAWMLRVENGFPTTCRIAPVKADKLPGHEAVLPLFLKFISQGNWQVSIQDGIPLCVKNLG